MMVFKNELPMDHETSMEHLADIFTKEIQEENEGLNMGTSWDCCRESAWCEIEFELECEGLEINDDFEIAENNNDME